VGIVHHGLDRCADRRVGRLIKVGDAIVAAVVASK